MTRGDGETLQVLHRWLASETALGRYERTLVHVTARPLTPEQAIGQAKYDDMAIKRGPEVMVEAEFDGAFGQAFTASPQVFQGSVSEILQVDVRDNAARAILVATANAVARRLGVVERTRHCKGDDVERCGLAAAQSLLKEFGKVPLAILGYQPGLVSGCAAVFGAENVRVTDLQPGNIGENRYGVVIEDGGTATEEVLRWARVALVTGTTAANGTLDGILATAGKYGTRVMIFGVTGAAAAHVLKLPHLCPYGT